MSYQDYCISQGFCIKIFKHPYFSNPDIKITTQGKTFAIGDSKRNNAQMIRNSKKAVAANYDKNQNLFDLEYTSYEYDEYGWYYYIEFIVEVSFFKVLTILTLEVSMITNYYCLNTLNKGVTAVAIKNLEIHMITSETQTISVFTKPINTEDDYSLHVEENLVPMGQESDLFKNVASFDKFPAIKIGAGEKMKIKVSCDTNCIKFNIVNDSMLVKGDHILVKGEKIKNYNRDTMFRGAIFYKKKCKNHKGKFIWKRKKKVNCKWISKEEKCSKGVAKQYCPKTCNVC